jgi:hypothetical protein
MAPVPPGEPLCVTCGVRAGITDDGEDTVCRPCLYRAGDRASRPYLFVEELNDLLAAHDEIAEPMPTACPHRFHWRWTNTWPLTGDLTLAQPEHAWKVIQELWRVHDEYEASR